MSDEEKEDYESELARMLSQEEESPGNKPMVYFADLYHKDHPKERIIERLTEVITRNTKVQQHHVLLLSPSANELNKVSQKTNIQDGNGITYHRIVTENKIQAFYEGKEFLDANTLNRMAMVCSCEQSGFWKQLGEMFFTKAYQMFFAVVGTGKMELTASYGLECEIEAFLQTLPSIGDIQILKSPLIPDAIFNHGFTTRNGGISSTPALRSLNLAFASRKRDSMLVINENRRRLAEAAGFNSKNMQFPKVEHGNRVWSIGQDVPAGFDAIVTRSAGITIAAPGADCVTILFADPVRRVCGATHAGWRGTLKGITVATIQAMVRDFGCDVGNIVVAIGPCLSASNLQFTPEDAKGFADIDPSLVLWKEGDQKVYVDLLSANKILLQRVGVRIENIDTSAHRCTYDNPGEFYSYRRDKFPFGNQIAYINIR
ncbi:purine nucleoside phosphorylase LACC1-like isoform X1 [Haliotis cracherodii]|uniref:purine nucleoside phosphorylase LACC1-like isoform X1 n=1 Tax=Haliotis cracherodii TaxID=6455 RepID=UPI0039E8056C